MERIPHLAFFQEYVFYVTVSCLSYFPNGTWKIKFLVGTDFDEQKHKIYLKVHSMLLIQII